MADKIIKLAAVGVGGIWNAHANNLAKLGGNQVVAVCDVSEENRAKAAKALGSRAYADVEQMLAAEKEIDGIVACTPPRVRRQIIEPAAQRGIPVFIEKPPAFTLDDAKAIVQIVRKHKASVGVMFMYRYLPAVDRLKQLIAGKPVSMVQSSFYCPAATIWQLPGWFYIKDKSGGHVLDQAVHPLDVVRYIAGDITEVFTLGSNVIRPKTADFTIEDSSATTLRFASGACGTHVHSWTHQQFIGFLTFIGKDYRLTLELDNRLYGFVGEQKIDETFTPPPQGCSHHYEEMRVFLEALRCKDFSRIRSPYVDAFKTLATVVAMNQSIDTGRSVKVATAD